MQYRQKIDALTASYIGVKAFQGLPTVQDVPSMCESVAANVRVYCRWTKTSVSLGTMASVYALLPSLLDAHVSREALSVQGILSCLIPCCTSSNDSQAPYSSLRNVNNMLMSNLVAHMITSQLQNVLS